MTMTISLEDQTVQWSTQVAAFSIEPFARECLLRGVDELGYMMRFLSEIEAFEQRRETETAP